MILNFSCLGFLKFFLNPQLYEMIPYQSADGSVWKEMVFLKSKFD